MHPLGKGFGETVSQGLDQNRVEIIPRRREPFGDRHFLDPGGHHKAADVIWGAGRGHEIGQRHIGPPVALADLLAQGM